MTIKKLITATAILGTSLVASPAEALNIEFTYDADVPFAHVLAAESAAAQWEALISDDITVKIHYRVEGYEAFGSKEVLGLAIPAMEENFTLDSAYASFKADQEKLYPGLDLSTREGGFGTDFCTRNQYGNEYFNNLGHWWDCTNLDFWALDMLRDGSLSTQYNPSGVAYTERAIYPFFDENQEGEGKTRRILATRAQLKALNTWHFDRDDVIDKEKGETPAILQDRYDGMIVMNNLKGAKNPFTGEDLHWAAWYDSYNVDNTQPFARNRISLPTVITHEIGHILGIFSGGDLVDNYSELINGDARAEQVTLFDFFRRDSQGRVNLNYGSPEKVAFYVGPIRNLDNNEKIAFGDFNREDNWQITWMSNGLLTNLGGDGAQASHPDQTIKSVAHYNSLWNNRKEYLKEYDDVMAPFMFTGWSKLLSPSDVQMIDAIGYETNYPVIRELGKHHFQAEGWKRAHEIFNKPGTPKLISQDQMPELDRNLMALMATSVDALIGEKPSFDTNYHLYATQGDLTGYDQRSLSREGRRRGLTQRQLNSLSRMRGIRNSLFGLNSSMAQLFNSTLQLTDSDGNQLEPIYLNQEGIFQNRAIYAEPEK